jgi:hypothetical protein
MPPGMEVYIGCFGFKCCQLNSVFLLRELTVSSLIIIEDCANNQNYYLRQTLAPSGFTHPFHIVEISSPTLPSFIIGSEVASHGAHNICDVTRQGAQSFGSSRSLCRDIFLLRELRFVLNNNSDCLHNLQL